MTGEICHWEFVMSLTVTISVLEFNKLRSVGTESIVTIDSYSLNKWTLLENTSLYFLQCITLLDNCYCLFD